MKNELINITRQTFPSLSQIFDKSGEAVNKVNTLSDNLGSRKSTSNVDITGDVIGNVWVDSRPKGNSVTGDSKSSGIPFQGSRTRSCRLCDSGHETRLCNKYIEAEDRILAFDNKFGAKPCARSVSISNLQVTVVHVRFAA